MQITTQSPGLEPRVSTRLFRLCSLGSVLVAAAALSPVRLGIVQGRSMTPTLEPGHSFLFSSQKSDRMSLRHGDVVVLRQGDGLTVKRVLALGGEHFFAFGSPKDPLPGCRLLTVNTPVRPWEQRWPRFKGRKVHVPPGHLFVVGDNPTSCDSRHFGPIPADRVVGRVFLSPPDEGDGLSLAAWSGLPPGPKRTSRHASVNGA